MTHGFFPHYPRFDIPHPFPCENHAPSQISFREHSWLGYLIKDAYLHDVETNMCRISQYTISTDSITEHNTTKSMVGISPLALHHD